MIGRLYRQCQLPYRQFSIRTSPPIVLRDYQITAIDKVLDAFENGVKRPAVVLATGGGKTVVMAHLIPRIKDSGKRKKTLVLAHKDELIRQISLTLEEVNPKMEISVDMLKQTFTPLSDVVVGSVPTLVRLSRLHKYDPSEYKAIVLDECHHATARSWMKILEYFKALDEDLPIAVVGFTATLERADGESLGKVFQEVTYQRSLLTMVQQGELCNAKFLTIKIDMDLSSIGSYEGDYKQKDLDGKVNRDEVNLQLSLAYKKLRKQLGLKSTLIFCVTIEHCKMLCSVLQAQGVNAQYVTGETVRHERREILQDFKDGKVEVLCNVMVFTEGTDIPNIDSLILARPTKSRPLLTQMIGRGLRLHKDKKLCHVIDLAHSSSIGILSVPTLFGFSGEMDIDQKTFLELSEKEEKEAASSNSCEDEVRKLLKASDRCKDWEVQLEEIGGFEMFMTYLNEDFETNKVFASHFMNWVRLEYHIWCAKTSKERHYWIIDTLHGENKDEGELFELQIASQKQIIASNFKCARKKHQLVSTGKLRYLMAIASRNMSKSYWGSSSTLATQKQQALLMIRLKTKVESLFGKEAVDRFQTKLGTLNQPQVTELIMASDYSLHCSFIYITLRKLMQLEPTTLEPIKAAPVVDIVSSLENISLKDIMDYKPLQLESNLLKNVK